MAAANYVVKVHYPKRVARGRGALVKSFASRQDAIDYAKSAASRGKRWVVPGTSLHYYMESPHNPTACVYNLRKWGTVPACFRFKWVETQVRTSKKSLATGRYKKTGMKAASVVKVPYTMLGSYGRRKR